MKGERVPEGSLINHSGNPTDNPAVMFEEPLGALRTMGLHKGSGVALVCDILGGAFTGGGAYLPERVVADRIVNNMLAILIDPTVFGGAEAFFGDVDAYTDWVKSSRPAPDTDHVRFPGDPERETLVERQKNGIPVDDATWAQLLETAGSVGLSSDDIRDIA